MLVVPDITDMFLPLNDGFLVDPLESRTVIEGLLDSLPGLTAETSIVEAAMTGPLKATMIALKSIGGQLNIFQTSLPTIGLGALKHREDTKLYGTDKEKTLFGPQDPFYRIAAEECVEAGIGINLFLFPSQYIDTATLGAFPAARYLSLATRLTRLLPQARFPGSPAAMSSSTPASTRCAMAGHCERSLDESCSGRRRTASR